MNRYDFQKSNMTSPLASLFRLIGLWLARSSQRRALAELEPFRLVDIGISPTERRHECRKRFWEN
jgi:uncharacterized protein YjiS (DUF1127 family)